MWVTLHSALARLCPSAIKASYSQDNSTTHSKHVWRLTSATLKWVCDFLYRSVLFACSQLDPRVHPAMFLKSFAILLGLVLAWWGAFFAPVGFYTALCCSVFLGVAKAEIGVSIQHDANHGAYSRSPVLGQIMSASLDLAGASRCVEWGCYLH